MVEVEFSRIPIMKSVQNQMNTKSLCIMIENSCNNSCIFCSSNITTERQNKPIAQLKRMLIESRKRGCTEVIFSGGEPTIYKDLSNVILFARNLQFKSIKLQSNGILLQDKNYVQKLLNCGISEFWISIHGDCSKIHDFLTGSPGNFKKVIKAILNIMNLGGQVFTNTTITKLNYRSLPALIDLLHSLDINCFQFLNVHPIRRAAKNFDIVVPRLQEVKNYIHSALETGKTFGMKGLVSGYPLCFMSGYEDCNAEIYFPPMEAIDAPVLIKNYGDYRINESKVKSENCRMCKFDFACEGIWQEYPRRIGWSEVIPVEGKKIDKQKFFRYLREGR